LVRGKPVADQELKEATFEPYEEDPEAAEEDAVEDELAWKMNLLMSTFVRELWGRPTLYWARAHNYRGLAPCL
jgi:hypothetical protein